MSLASPATGPSPVRIPVQVFFALFTISGFAGLIYESIWSHYLKLFLGHAAYAQTLVLAIFMGGMAVGSWLVSRFTLRISNLLLGYAIAELGIGILALVFHPVFRATTGWALDSLFPAMGPVAIDAVKWTIASALILPASLLLGTTFPLMSGGVLRLYPEAGGGALAMLYFTNSLGAAVGVLASGFFLIAKVGLPGTIVAAGTLNVVLAFAVWLLAKRMPAAASLPAAAAGGAAPAARSTLARVILILAFATGAASFVYEITWIRMLTTGLGASTHAFEVMLSAFILGMALGAYVLRGRIERIANDIAWLAAIVFAKAVLAVYAVWIYGDVLEFIRWVMNGVAKTDQGYTLVTSAGLIASMLVMLPTAFCAGMTLPLATQALARRGEGERSIGRLYAANTAGCIAGAAFATHLGMELLGVKNLTGLGALIDLAAVFLILACGTEGLMRKRLVGAAAGCAAVAAIAFSLIQLDLLKMSSGVFRFGVFEDPADASVIFYRDGKTASISVTDNKTNKRRAIRTNGKTDAALTFGEGINSGPDEPTMVLAAAIPLALRPDAELVANIGFGSGLTTHSLLGSPRVKRVDSIEIERMMIEGARHFQPRNARAYEDPRSLIHIDDAKTFFASRGTRYDVIVSEPSNPWVSGVSTLFSEEFYRQLRGYLKPDGLLVQWIQSYDISVDLLATVFKALGKEFGDYAVYRAGGVDLLIIATPGKALPEMTDTVFRFAGIAADLRYLGYEELDDLRALRVGGRRSVQPVFAMSVHPANSDYFPILDQEAPQARFRGDNAQDFTTNRDNPVPVLALLDEETRTPLRRISKGGINRPLRIDKALMGAEMIGVFLSGRSDGARTLNPDQKAAALLANALLAGCRGAEEDWLAALFAIVGSSAPFLQQPDVEVVFEKVRASACWRSLDDPSRNAVLLLEALNKRDAKAMHALGEALLDAPRLTTPLVRVALHSAVAGSLAQGDTARARALWDRHSSKLPPEARSDFTSRLLFSHLRASLIGGASDDLRHKTAPRASETGTPSAGRNLASGEATAPTPSPSLSH